MPITPIFSWSLIVKVTGRETVPLVAVTEFISTLALILSAVSESIFAGTPLNLTDILPAEMEGIIPSGTLVYSISEVEILKVVVW